MQHVGLLCVYSNRRFSECNMHPLPATDLEIERIQLEPLDMLVRTLLALEVAYQYRHFMPTDVATLLKKRIDEARGLL